jgi:hypothetical protein
MNIEDIQKKADEWYNRSVTPSRKEMQQDICAWYKDEDSQLREVMTMAFFYGYTQALEEMNPEYFTLTIDGVKQKVYTGTMSYMIGNHKIVRDDYWNMTDDERQALHDQYDSGSKAMEFDPKFAWKHGKNPNGPF